MPSAAWSDPVRITSIGVEPSLLAFTGVDALSDTLITFEVSALVQADTRYTWVASWFAEPSGEFIGSDTLSSASAASGALTASRTWQQSPVQFTDMRLMVYPLSSANEPVNRAETRVRVQWSDTGTPQVEELIHPEEITLPSAGSPEVTLFVEARVAHSVSLKLLSRVELELLDSDLNRLAIYEMSDADESFGNEPGEGVYVQGFSVSSDNAPGEYVIRVRALDFAETSSDVAESRFAFVR